MEKGLLFLTLSILCLWLVLDEFFGERRLTAMVLKLTPDSDTTIGEIKEKVTAKMDEAVKRQEKRKGTLTDKMKDRYSGVDSPA